MVYTFLNCKSGYHSDYMGTTCTLHVRHFKWMCPDDIKCSLLIILINVYFVVDVFRYDSNEVYDYECHFILVEYIHWLRCFS